MLTNKDDGGGLKKGKEEGGTGGGMKGRNPGRRKNKGQMNKRRQRGS